MLLIRNGKILTMEGKDYEKGSILVENGKIKAVGENIAAPEGVEIIDAGGAYVLPGMIDAHTHLGLSEANLRWEGNDTNEATEPATPHMRAIDAINPLDSTFKDSVKGGITAVVAGPGSGNVIGGTLAAIKTGGSSRADNLVIKSPLAMKCAFGENPKNLYGQGKKVAPMTRMATAAIMRESLFKAKDYAEKKAQVNSDPSKKPEYNIKNEALLPVLNREIPLHAHAHRADDIFTAIRIANEFNIKLVLVHCTEGHLIHSDIKAEGLNAIVGPTLTHRSKPEVTNKSFGTAGILQKNGVKVCITTDHPVIPIEHLPLCAALCVRDGMDEKEALKAITINAAEIMELSDRIGSLKEGKDADIVIWSKHPFDSTAMVLHTIIDGKIVYSKQS